MLRGKIVEYEKSAGVIIFRLIGGTPFYFLLRHSFFWSFPKGKIEEGEGEKEAALREVEEETGLKKISIIPDFREEITYTFRRDKNVVKKKVVYFLGEVENGETRISDEHLGGEWVTYNEAMEMLLFSNLKNVLDKAHHRVYDLIKGRRIKNEN